jgi:hypothetical protein
MVWAVWWEGLKTCLDSRFGGSHGAVLKLGKGSVGEPMPGSDFGAERGRGAAKCRGHRLERRQFTAVEASEKAEQVAHVLAESLNGQNPTGRLAFRGAKAYAVGCPKIENGNSG